MKSRLLTPEERRLWRESNRFTTLKENAAPEELTPIVDEGRAGALLPPIITKPVRATRLAPLSILTAREANRSFKPYPIDATLDLHGLSKLEAYDRVQAFLVHQHAAGRRHVVIITGKGRGGEAGVLRSHLPHWLNEMALRSRISAFAHAKPEKGGAGVLHVLLKAR